MIAQFGNQLIQLFRFFGLRPAAGSSSIKISGCVTMRGRSPDGAGHRRPGYSPDGWVFQQTNALKPGGGAVERFTLARRKDGVFNRPENSPVFSCYAAPPAGFQLPSFHGTDAHAEGTHHAHAGDLLPRQTFQMLSRSKMVPPVGL